MTYTVGWDVKPYSLIHSEYWELSSQPTSASRNTSRRSAQHVQRTLSTESAMTMMNAFLMSQVDYCNVVFAGAPKAITDKLQRVLNTAARVVTRTRKFDHSLKQLIHSELHWLDAPERIKYKLSMFMHRCLDGTAPRYLATHCTLVSATASRHHLYSAAASHQCVVPSYRLSSYGRQVFSVADPMTWNSLPRHLRDPIHTISVFERLLKTFLFSEY